MAFNPPFSFTAADLSNNDLGMVCPDKSSMAAGKFSDARTLVRKKKNQDQNIVCTRKTTSNERYLLFYNLNLSRKSSF